MNAPQPLPRDVFVDEIFEAAKTNKDIYFLSADLGAMALDRFREELPEQFIHCGISEANMIDLAAGLALNGKTVYIYAMATFATYRCYEQIKVALSLMDLPATIIGVGVGLSYDDASPTHYSIEDIATMRSLAGMEILSPSDTESCRVAARQTYKEPKLRYLRLDRKFLPDVYQPGETHFADDGLAEISPGKDLLIIASGYMVSRARKLKEQLAEEGIDAGIADVYSIKPFGAEAFVKLSAKYPKFVTLEEHLLDGGFGSIVAECMSDNQIFKPLKRLGLEDHYVFDNGGRDYILELWGMGYDHLLNQIKNFAK